jgi:hypothetical protein
MCAPTLFASRAKESTATCTNLTSGSQVTFMNNVEGSAATNFPLIPDSTITSIEDMSKYLLSNRADFEASQIGAYSFAELGSNNNGISNLSYVIHSNYTALHTGPLYCAILADTVIKTIDTSGSVTINLNPLPDTFKEDKINSNYNINLVVIFILLAIPYVPAAFATFIVREREVTQILIRSSYVQKETSFDDKTLALISHTDLNSNSNSDPNPN